MKRKRLSELLPESPGIIATINASYPLNFLDTETQAGQQRIADMDYDYIWTSSGEKKASDITMKQYDEDTDTFSLARLARIVGMRYADKWNAMWEALTVEYDILENYNRTETESTGKDATETDGLTESITESVADTEANTGTITDVLDGEVKNTGTETTVLDGETKDTGTDTLVVDGETTRAEDETTEGSLYGFNSATASDADKTVRDYDDTTTEDRTDTRTLNLKTERDDTNTKTLNTKTETDNTNTQTLNTSKTNNHTANNSKASNRTGRTIEEITRRLTVAGNIGVISNEQMQEQRLTLLDKWYEFYQNVVYRDIDKVLALSIY